MRIFPSKFVLENVQNHGLPTNQSTKELSQPVVCLKPAKRGGCWRASHQLELELRLLPNYIATDVKLNLSLIFVQKWYLYRENASKILYLSTGLIGLIMFLCCHVIFCKNSCKFFYVHVTLLILVLRCLVLVDFEFLWSWPLAWNRCLSWLDFL